MVSGGIWGSSELVSNVTLSLARLLPGSKAQPTIRNRSPSVASLTESFFAFDPVITELAPGAKAADRESASERTRAGRTKAVER